MSSTQPNEKGNQLNELHTFVPGDLNKAAGKVRKQVENSAPFRAFFKKNTHTQKKKTMEKRNCFLPAIWHYALLWKTRVWAQVILRAINSGCCRSRNFADEQNDGAQEEH